MSSIRGGPDHVGDPVGHRRVFTGPNAVTAFRLLLVPVLAWLLFAGGTLDESSRWWATGVFVLAAVTDFIDGAWARQQGSVTTLGKVADPIADKAITAVALVGLSWWGLLPWWVTVVILAREVIVTAARFVVIRHGVIAASRGGKAKTIAQIIAIALFLAPISDAWAPVQWERDGRRDRVDGGHRVWTIWCGRLACESAGNKAVITDRPSSLSREDRR
jgi:CDP-diacylglycerol--glycerol-3-phosphate 3-phosphatidyltransferase